MTERSVTVSADDALMSEVWLAMGYVGNAPEDQVRDAAVAIAGRLVPAARLRFIYDIVPAMKISPTRVRMGDREFAVGGIIGSYLEGMTEACVFIATAGAEFDAAVRELKSEEDILADFIADSIGSVLAERAVALLDLELESQGHGVSLPYSPGYCGWDIREQQSFFGFFPPKPCGVTLSPSSLMSPEKSVSGFFSMGKELVRQPYHCEICQNKSCFKRKNASPSR